MTGGDGGVMKVILTGTVWDLLQFLFLGQLNLNLPEHGVGQLHQLHDLLDEAHIV